MSMYQQHPLSAAWPAMSEAEFHSLKESIENIGVQMPIVIFEDQVIDGWNRYRAANDLGMDCPTTAFDDSLDPRDFVKAMNDARRHITGSQRAIAIVAIYKWHPAHRGNKVEVTSTLTQKALAEEAGVSKKTIQQAQAAQKAGLSEKVKSGELSVEQASNIAKGKPAKPEAKPAEPTPVNHELEEAAQAINELAAENEELRDRVAVAAMQGTDEEKAEAAQTIAELRSHITTLEAELDATRTSRDGFQSQNSELMKQVRMLERKLKKVGG
jgi:ribosomal protein L11